MKHKGSFGIGMKHLVKKHVAAVVLGQCDFIRELFDEKLITFFSRRGGGG